MVIGDFTFPGEQFVLRDSVSLPDVEIEIERLVAHIDDGLTPYFRITAEDFEAVERALREDATITDLTCLETVEDERFYRAHWNEGHRGLMSALGETDGALLSATFRDGYWEVRVLFGERGALSAFFDRCHDELEFDISLLRVFDRQNPATYGEYNLTEKQRDTLLEALESGFYEIPRRSELDGLAADLDVSPQAVSQRLRRAYTNLIESTIATEEIEEGN